MSSPTHSILDHKHNQQASTQEKTQSTKSRMGNTWERLAGKFRNTQVRILMIGLDAAGKTTTLYKLKLGEVVTTIPTIGFNVETVKYKGFDFTTWDVSGRSGIRALWRHYFQGTEAIVFVLDSNDRDRISECKDEIQYLLREDEIKDCPLLVLANKQDLSDAMSIEEITEKLELNTERAGHKKWHVQGTCATKGDGLYEGLEWLATAITERRQKRPKGTNWWTSLFSYFRLERSNS